MGAAPIVIFRGLGQSRAQGHGELGPPHFPGYEPRCPFHSPGTILYHIRMIVLELCTPLTSTK